MGNKKILFKFAKWAGISNTYGDETLFLYFNNSPDVEWVYVRRPDINLTYFGALESYAEIDNVNEIVLSDVSVYGYEESDKYYDVDKIYLSIEKKLTIIETAKK